MLWHIFMDDFTSSMQGFAEKIGDKELALPLRCMYYDGGVVTKQTFIYSQHSSSNNNNNNTTTTMTVERGYSVSLIRHYFIESSYRKIVFYFFLFHVKRFSKYFFLNCLPHGCVMSKLTVKCHYHNFCYCFNERRPKQKLNRLNEKFEHGSRGNK
uniref:CSON001300 protein n=1 Tax=Culicoides sonorensis TaxID=179676 RepID=A0A336L002_CULSO